MPLAKMRSIGAPSVRLPAKAEIAGSFTPELLGVAALGGVMLLTPDVQAELRRLQDDPFLEGIDAVLFDDVEELRWRGETPDLEGWAHRIGDERLALLLPALTEDGVRGRGEEAG